MSANAYVHVPACARCCDGCVFWHQVSEIAPHAQRHTTPHKAAHSCLATYVQDMRRQAGGIVILHVITSEFCELDPQLVSNGPQHHNRMREKTQSVWGDMSWQTSCFPEPILAEILTKRPNHPCFCCIMHSHSVCSVCYYCKPVINDVIAAFRIHVLVHQRNYTLERKKLWGIFFIILH